jgi:ribonuclease HI
MIGDLRSVSPQLDTPNHGVLVQNVRGLCDPRGAAAKIDLITNVIGRDLTNIIILTETKLYTEEKSRNLLKFMDVKDGQRRWFARHALQETKQSSGGGVSILFRSDLSSYMAEQASFRGFAFAQSLVTTGNGRLMVIGLYLSHDPLEARNTAQWVLNRVTRALQKDYEIIIGGDFNTESTQNAEFLQDLIDHGLWDAGAGVGNLSPTRFPEGRQCATSSPHRLDYVLLSHGLAQGVNRNSYKIDKMLVDKSWQSLKLDNIPVTLPIACDHAAVIVTAPEWEWLFDKSLARAIKKRIKEAGRFIVDISSTPETDRNKFAGTVVGTLQGPEFTNAVNSGDLDRAWDKFATAIDDGVHKFISKRKVGGKTSFHGGRPRLDDISNAIALVHGWHKAGYRSPLHNSAHRALLRVGLTREELVPYTTRLTAPVQAESLMDRKRQRKRFIRILVVARTAIDASAVFGHIKDAISKRESAFTTNVRSVIQSALRKRRNQSSIDHVVIGGNTSLDGEQQIARDPDTVRTTIATQVSPWFSSEGPVDLESAPSHWREAFLRKTDVDPSIWNGLMEPITAAELKVVMGKCALDKAPGGSGHTTRLYQMIWQVDPSPVLCLLNMVLNQRRTPKEWKKAIIYLIPKSASGFTGTAEGTRPISLLETMSKLLMKVLLERMTVVLLNHRVLTGAKYSGLPGTDTTVPIAILHAAATQAKFRRDQLWVYFEDKSKAFDTVPHDLLKKALQRICLPDSFIDFYMNGFLLDREARIITCYGLSDLVHVNRGIPQGAVESPLMWNIFYDVCLAAVNSQFRESIGGIRPPIKGYPLTAAAGLRKNELGVPITPLKPIHTSWITSVAYMDDAAFFARSRKELQAIINLVDEFNSLARVKANPAKGAVLSINAPSLEMEQPLKATSANGIHLPIPWVAQSGFRYLGIWIDGTFSGRAAIASAEREISGALRQLRHRCLTAKIVTYLLNSCVIPAFIYRTRAGIPAAGQLDRWNASLRDICRRALGRARSLVTPMVHSTSLLGLNSLPEAVVQHHFTEIAVLLNMAYNSEGGTAIRSEIGVLQALTHCPVSPLERPDLALTSWMPSGNRRMTWFDNLIPIMRARGLSIADIRGEFNLLDKESRTCPMVEHLPWLLAPRMHGEKFYFSDNKWALRVRSMVTYFVDEIVPLDLAQRSSLPRLCEQVRDARSVHGITPITRATDIRIAQAIMDINTGVRPASSLTPMVDWPSQHLQCSNMDVRRTPYDLDVFETPPEIVSPLRGSGDSGNQEGAHPVHTVAFTDGSLFRHGPKDATHTRAGAGAYFPVTGHSLACRLGPAPFSSTRAELQGLILAMAAAPYETHLMVYTDSQALQKSSERCLSDSMTVRSRLRTQNNDLWSAARVVQRQRGITTTVHWIKGHNGNAPNELADLLADIGANSDHTHAVAQGVTHLSDFIHRPMCYGLPICGDPRAFMKQQFEAECRLLLYDPDSPLAISPVLLPIAEKINWRATSIALHGGVSPYSRHTSRELNRDMLFRLRIWNDTLPCGTVIHSMYSGNGAHHNRGLCDCGAVDNEQHWILCCKNALNFSLAKRRLTTRLWDHVTNSMPVARSLATWLLQSKLQILQTAAAIVTNDLMDLFRSTVPKRVRRIQNKGPTSSVATIMNMASSEISAVWSAHAKRLAAAHHIRPMPRRAEAVAPDPPPSQAIPPEPDVRNPPRRDRQAPRLRCVSCYAQASKHRTRVCDTRKKLITRIQDMLQGGDPLCTPGLARTG